LPPPPATTYTPWDNNALNWKGVNGIDLVGAEQPQKRSVYEGYGEHKRYDLSDMGLRRLHQRQGELNQELPVLAPKERRLSKVVACCRAARALTTLMQATSGMGTPRPAARPQAIAICRGLALTPVFSSKL